MNPTTDNYVSMDVIKTMYLGGYLTTQQVVLAACLAAGFSEDDATSISAQFAPPRPKKQAVRQYRRWAPEEKALLKSLYEAGTSRDEIASLLQMDKKRVIGMISVMRLNRPRTTA